MGGMSAGACLTAVLSRKFQEEKLAHPLTGQWLAAAPTMDNDTCPEKYKSYYIAQQQNAESPVMSQESFQKLRDLTGWDMNSDLRNASRSMTPLSGQPKTYTQAEGMDILRDDMLIYDEMLKEAGVPTKIDLYDGCVHGTMFHMMGTDLGNKILIDAIVGLGWLLDKTVARGDAEAAVGIK
jgi:acetyl esterase/lipase